MRLFLTGLLLLLAGPALGQQSNLIDLGGPGFVRAASDDANDARTYIVQLGEPSTAESLAVAKTRTSVSKTTPGAESYSAKLLRQQDTLLGAHAPGAEKIYSYTWSMNGFAARMTPAQADKLRNRPEVVNVWEDEIRPLATNFSADYLELFDNQSGLRGPLGLTGEDIVIGFIDSGIYPEHPQLADTREADRPSACRSSWGRNSLLGRWLCRRYDKLEDVVLYEPPENWNGACEAGQAFEEAACNNKLIGARFFIDGAESTGPIDSGEIRSARDVDGHGTHTATTAAGNRQDASIYGSFVDRVEGIAPRARVAVYKACWLRPGATRASCNTSDLANAIDQAVADGVDIISYSVGSSFLRVTSPDDI
ncbi:MAG: S8 family serine peptidase, partial [Pseudomonadota bacterium]